MIYRFVFLIFFFLFSFDGLVYAVDWQILQCLGDNTPFVISSIDGAHIKPDTFPCPPSYRYEFMNYDTDEFNTMEVVFDSNFTYTSFSLNSDGGTPFDILDDSFRAFRLSPSYTQTNLNTGVSEYFECGSGYVYGGCYADTQIYVFSAYSWCPSGVWGYLPDQGQLVCYPVGGGDGSCSGGGVYDSVSGQCHADCSLTAQVYDAVLLSCQNCSMDTYFNSSSSSCQSCFSTPPDGLFPISVSALSSANVLFNYENSGTHYLYPDSSNAPPYFHIGSYSELVNYQDVVSNYWAFLSDSSISSGVYDFTLNNVFNFPSSIIDFWYVGLSVTNVPFYSSDYYQEWTGSTSDVSGINYTVQSGFAYLCVDSVYTVSGCPNEIVRTLCLPLVSGVTAGCSAATINVVYDSYISAVDSLFSKFPFSFFVWGKDLFQSLTGVLNSDTSFRLSLSNYVLIDIPRSFVFNLRDIIYLSLVFSFLRSKISKIIGV